MGRHIKYSIPELKNAVKTSSSVLETMQKLGYTKLAGGSAYYLKQKIIKYNIDFSHFSGQSHRKGKKGYTRKSPKQILVKQPPGKLRSKRYQLKRALLEIGVEYKCDECKIGDVYNEKPLILHVDHINGDWSDDRKDNLRFLCPNCHSQTPTFGFKKR